MEQTSNLARLEIQSLEAKGQIQDLETQKEVWMSLLKGLPTVIVVTVVAAVTSLIYSGDAGSRIATSASIMAFIGTSVLWAFSLAFTMRADDKLVKLKDASETIERKEEKLRNEAREMFLRYKSTMMTNQTITPSYGILDYDSCTMSYGQVTDWRTVLTKDRQADMDHMNRALVQKMDQLRDISKDFVTKFNAYVGAVWEEVLGLALNGIEEYGQKDVRRMLIYGIYSYVSGSFFTSHRESDYELFLRQVPQLEGYLARLTNRPAIETKIRTIIEKDGLVEIAQEALKAHDSIIGLYNRMMVELRYEYSAET